MSVVAKRSFSLLVKRTVVIDGRKTSVTLEEPFWSGLKEIADRERLTVSKIVTMIDKTREKDQNLSSAIRLFILEETKNRKMAKLPN